MKYMLDTNICIYLINESDHHVLNKFKHLSLGDIGISSVTYAELLYGVHKSQRVEQNLQALQEFALPLEISPFDDEACHHYGEIRSHLEKKGVTIGPLDQMIAAHARCLKTILVTNNKKEFSRIPGLLVENWVRDH